MRKHRGKCKDSGKWLYGHYCEVTRDDTTMGYIIVNVVPSSDSVHFIAHEVDPDTVGQEIGLYDIYEGDVLDDGTQIEYGCTSCGCCSYVHGYDLETNAPHWGLTVKGNIHDNPELRED